MGYSGIAPGSESSRIEDDFMRLLYKRFEKVIVFFDNDEAGYKKSEEKLKENYPVFLWKKLFEDIVNKKNINYQFTSI